MKKVETKIIYTQTILQISIKPSRYVADSAHI